MTRPSRYFEGVLFVCLLAAGSCDDGDDAEADDDAGADEAPVPSCETETRNDTFTVGLEKTDDRIRVVFVEAQPAPPARGDNRWTVQVLDVNTGEPLSGCAGEATPWMPDHMHGTTVEAHVTPGASPGEYVVEPVNLYMPPLWDVTLDFTCPGEIAGTVVFTFCFEP